MYETKLFSSSICTDKNNNNAQKDIFQWSTYTNFTYNEVFFIYKIQFGLRVK